MCDRKERQTQKTQKYTDRKRDDDIDKERGTHPHPHTAREQREDPEFLQVRGLNL